MSLADFIGGSALYPTGQDEIVPHIYGASADSLRDNMIGHPEHLEQHYSLTAIEPIGHYFTPSTIEASPTSSPTDSPPVSTSQLPNQTAVDTFDFALPSSQLPITSPTTPQLLEYRPLPPMSPRIILSTLDDMAASQPKKKSHARKQPAGHIPRPRNAFILFRCLFVSQQAVPASVEKDHRNISRIAGRVWKSMSEADREPWVKAAEIEKMRHEEKWPGYRYNPVQPASNASQMRRNITANIAGGSRNATTSSPIQERGRPLFRKPALSSAAFDLHFNHPYPKPEYGDLHTPMAFSPVPMHAPQPMPSHALSNLFPHAPVPRVGSAPLRLDNLAAHPDFDREMMSNQPMSAVHFTHLFFQQNTDTGTPTGTTPTSTYSYDASPQFPPDSPIYTFSHQQSLMNSFPRPPARRSSSCPPLPPGPATGGNPFSFASADPWVGPTPSAYGLPTGGAMDLSDDSGATMFRNPFSFPSMASNGTGGDAAHDFTAGFASSFGESHGNLDATTAVAETLDEIRPSTPTATQPAHPTNTSFLFHTPRYQHVYQDTHYHPHYPTPAPSRLVHRRGSSLDRAIASSSIAGAFGASSGFAGQWSRASQQWGQALWANTSASNLNPNVSSNVNGQSQPQEEQQQEASIVSLEHSSSSSTLSTPTLSPSSSDPLPTSASSSESNPSSSSNSDLDTSSSPFTFPYPAFNARKLSTRLFGSQGKHLGLDLDLDAPGLLSREGGSGLSSAESEEGPYTPRSAQSRVQRVKEEEFEAEVGEWMRA